MVPPSDEGFAVCGWVDVYTVEDAEACTLAGPEPRCIEIHYQGEGCAAWPTCGSWDSEVATIYHRNSDGVLELFSHPFCEMQPNDWSPCEWPEVDGTTGTTGPPDAGPPNPAACRCLCP